MNRFKLKYSRYNEQSILIEWPSIIDESILKDILNFKKSIEFLYVKQNIEVINTYNSILIIYNTTIDDVNDKILMLKDLYKQNISAQNMSSNSWEIPVCYDEEFGVDLSDFSQLKKLSKKEIISLHSNETYTVFFIGFLPGFLYLGGLNPKLYLDRKSTPNLNVSKGSVAIGGQQTGIYPQESPGGWHIIGKTPIELFNPDLATPCFINSGDMVRFKPINMSEYLDIESQIANSSFQLKPLKFNA